MGKIIKIENRLLAKKKRDKKPRIGVIVQARMTSRRFPGKSMALLLGKPVLERVLERVITIPDTKTVIAVPDTPESEPMIELASKMGVDNFCGSELNVLNRYLKTAKYFKFDYIVRITGDCPFIDPRVCKECIDLLLFRKLDYCSNVFPNRTFPQGLDCEVFSFDCLDAAHQEAAGPYDLEHITPWMQRTDGIMRANIEQRVDTSHLNFCVDVPEDIARLEALANEKVIKV